MSRGTDVYWGCARVHRVIVPIQWHRDGQRRDCATDNPATERSANCTRTATWIRSATAMTSEDSALQSQRSHEDVDIYTARWLELSKVSRAADPASHPRTNANYDCTGQ